MGYYTKYTLTVRKIKNEEWFKKLQEELRSRELIGYAFDEGHYSEKNKEAIFYMYDECKWYNHAEDMVMIAEKFPKMYFQLEGFGEEFQDFWHEYYHDMDVEVCHGEIVFEQPKKVQWTELIPF